MSTREPNGNWRPESIISEEIMQTGYEVVWQSKDRSAPVFVVRRKIIGIQYYHHHHHFVARRTAAGIELSSPHWSKTRVLRLARELNRDPNGKTSASTARALAKRGFRVNDVAIYAGVLYRIVGGGSQHCHARALFAFDGMELSRDLVSKIKWHNLERVDLQNLAATYMALGDFIKAESRRLSGDP